MDPFRPETWKNQWEVFISAPYLAMPLMVMALMVGWWIGNRLAGARLEGLSGSIDNFKANIEALKQRLDLAIDREADVQRARTELEQQVLELKAQIAVGAPNEKLAAASAKVGVAITEFSTANDALTIALTDQNSEPEFYAQLEQRLPGQADKLKAFVGSLKPLGIEPNFGKSLFLRWRTADGSTLSAGTIEPTGSIWLLKTVTDARLAGNQPAGERYLETIARLVDGSIKRYDNGSIDVRGPDERSLRLPTLIEFAPVWKDAISKLINDTRRTRTPPG
jgi:hypothetical protein